jgi:hypothetical protein
LAGNLAADNEAATKFAKSSKSQDWEGKFCSERVVAVEGSGLQMTGGSLEK